MSGQFRVTVWDPKLIISQIVAVTSLVYCSFGAILIIASLFTGTDITLRHVFNYKAVNFNDRDGILIISGYALSSLSGSLGLWLIVKRTKQCLDFTATCYLIHLIISWLYNGSLPDTASWWILNIASITIMCVCGEFLCLRTELQHIPLLGTKVDL